MDIDMEFTIGNASEDERKELFLKYFAIKKSGDDAAPMHMIHPSLQDPYNPKSWPTRKELQFKMLSSMSDAFTKRYNVVAVKKLRSGSITQPDLYDIDAIDDYYKEILYNRSDLFMKVTPLIADARECEKTKQKEDCGYKKDNFLDEIYNEIIIAYFLNELFFGYSSVLSIHFMTLVDWFIAERRSVNPSLNRESYLCQVTISEKADLVLSDVLKGLNNDATLTTDQKTRHCRAWLFQVFHALETAWHTNRYLHNDLHLGNVMIQLVPPDSPLHDKDFLYRRLDSTNWYRVPYRDLDNGVIKIIDFGRNRMAAPWQPSHKFSNRHIHERIIALKEYYIESGYNLATVNQGIDVHVLLQSLYRVVTLPLVREMIARVLPNHQKEAYKLRKNAPTPTDVLNDYFFKTYNVKKMLPDEATKSDILAMKKTAIVVSFLNDASEAEMLIAGNLHGHSDRCSVCRSTNVNYRVGDNEMFCDVACYEFRYVFDGKTAFR
jgi:hypothetical protein